MPAYILRNIDPELWLKVSDRAKREGRTLRGLLLLLLAHYVKHGAPEAPKKGK